MANLTCDSMASNIHEILMTDAECRVGKMLAHILTTALDELEGKESDYTICTPIRHASRLQPKVRQTKLS